MDTFIYLVHDSHFSPDVFTIGYTTNPIIDIEKYPKTSS